MAPHALPRRRTRTEPRAAARCKRRPPRMRSACPRSPPDALAGEAVGLSGQEQRTQAGSKCGPAPAGRSRACHGRGTAKSCMLQPPRLAPMHTAAATTRPLPRHACVRACQVRGAVQPHTCNCQGSLQRSLLQTVGQHPRRHYSGPPTATAVATPSLDVVHVRAAAVLQRRASLHPRGRASETMAVAASTLIMAAARCDAEVLPTDAPTWPFLSYRRKLLRKISACVLLAHALAFSHHLGPTTARSSMICRRTSQGPGRLGHAPRKPQRAGTTHRQAPA